jgi:STE24 endopeptidase
MPVWREFDWRINMNGFAYLTIAALFVTEIAEVAFSALNVQYLGQVVRDPSRCESALSDREGLKKTYAYLKAQTRSRCFFRLLVYMPVFYFLLLSGQFSAWAWHFNQLSDNEVIRGTLFLMSFGFVFFLIQLPFNIHRIFVIEAKFGFNSRSFPLFVKDTVKTLFTSALFMILLVSVLVIAIQVTGEFWWLYSALFFTSLMLTMNIIFPKYIAPHFNRYEELAEGTLKSKIRNLARRAGLALDSIYKVDTSRRSRHSNASFTGIGANRRIVLSDTLLNNLDDDEVTAIVAHELGHFRLNHIRKGLVERVGLIFMGFFIMGYMVNSEVVSSAFGFDRSLSIGLFLAFIVFAPLRFFTRSITNYVSHRREYDADSYAVSILKGRSSLVQALIGIHRDNLTNPFPHPVYSQLFHSHPTLQNRIAAIESI